MQQYIFKDKIYICGKITEVTSQLKELACRFSTVKELLDYYMATED